MGKVRREKPCGRLKAVFGGEMATAKIQTVKGLRVEIFSRPLRKNTTRPLTVWIVGTGKMLIVFRYRIWYNSFGTDRQIGIGSKL